MKSKSNKLWILLAMQAVVIALLAFTSDSGSRLNFDTALFTVTDTASISKIELHHEAEIVKLSKLNDRWFINEKEIADQSLMVYVKSILHRVTVQRPISGKQQAQVYANLKNEAPLVKLYNGETLVKEFYAGGNEGKTKSYFALDGVPYIVNVPGYQDYLSGVFKLKSHQWKDRRVSGSSWRSISKIEVEKATGDGFVVAFTGQDLTVEGVNPLDTNNMMNYVSQYAQFMINEFVMPGQFERYDSLKLTTPEATITLQDLDESRNFQWKVFPRLPKEGYHLITDQQGRMMMVDMRRVGNLIPPRKFFVKRPMPKRNF
ncbi:MAG: hypothetical protein AAFO69_00405 [Bacteroidota bacterium]